MTTMDSKNGIWLDQDTGKVVTKQPSRGKVLVTPGGDIPEHVQRFIDGDIETATAPADVETTADDGKAKAKTVTTAKLSKSRGK